MITIHSIQVGMPKTYKEDDESGVLKPWRTAIFKELVHGAVRATTEGLAGDSPADRRHHGGPDKAINAYCHVHYPHWKKDLSVDAFPSGAFGENLTLDGVYEDDVCIGDMFDAGGVLLQITQPRQPCNTLARKWKTPDLVRRVETNGFTGWYFRVLKEGDLVAGLELKLIERKHPKWTVTAANNVLHHRIGGSEAARELSAVPALSAAWHDALARR